MLECALLPPLTIRLSALACVSSTPTSVEIGALLAFDAGATRRSSNGFVASDVSEVRRFVECSFRVSEPAIELFGDFEFEPAALIAAADRCCPATEPVARNPPRPR